MYVYVYVLKNKLDKIAKTVDGISTYRRRKLNVNFEVFGKVETECGDTCLIYILA